MNRERAVIIGAGIGGLSAAISLSREGYAVTVLERAATVGGKMREVEAGGARIDAGPTVLTMRWVFDALFEAAGARLGDYVALQKLSILARHAWSNGAQLDLFADEAESADAIGAFAGAAEARGYLDFCAEARRMFDTLREPFLTASKPNPLTLTSRVRLARIGELFAIRPFDTMWNALGTHFRDQRLRQLFGRYATYCGSSPFDSPATLMLIAHVEQDGVWIVEGGMQRLAEALKSCAEKLGVTFRFNAEASQIETKTGRVSAVRLRDGERIEADAVVCNADPSALAAGLFGHDATRAVAVGGAKRSLSAVTWAGQAKTRGFPLVRHNVFFSDDYAAEFKALEHSLPTDPTIYICAQDRDDLGAADDPERLLILANAPAHGDARPFTSAELDACETNMLNRLQRCGLELTPSAMVRTTPTDFNALFPATGGALYGRATRGWAASFQRPGARTKIPGLYLAGGGVHPGAGVPMAALSGQQAARSILADRVSTCRSHPVAIPGGTSTRSAMTNSTA
ncbi:1-hydroxycarotenoid 3,4-desaturase CrtD [Terricaulis sp.]|uniref:1-hydroxycarotenoid 3,4-desaturase CrtD n=1 Tax=Terricaulis sp. TaxID=2768686 RepID=UPI002AC4B299|nr:1-hydroxycarotenoid 3,4-desaturase CrtD [Terricaulis sp.]MDZ4691541.1 phytoene desaturase family protein [Terricaulis sp.]